jgi:serine protease inhibitor
LEVSAYIRKLIVAAALLTSIVVDHPFFFAITEQESGAVLFAGIVMDPTLTGGAR